MASKGPSKATLAVGYALAAGVELWHDEDGQPYADVRGEKEVDRDNLSGPKLVSFTSAPRRTLRVRSRDFRTWLSGLFFTLELADVVLHGDRDGR